MTRRTAGPLKAKTFTVMDDYTLTGGSDTISILPPIYGPASTYQNVDALPLTGAALTLWPGSSSRPARNQALSVWGSPVLLSCSSAQSFICRKQLKTPDRPGSRNGYRCQKSRGMGSGPVDASQPHG